MSHRNKHFNFMYNIKNVFFRCKCWIDFSFILPSLKRMKPLLELGRHWAVSTLHRLISQIYLIIAPYALGIHSMSQPITTAIQKAEFFIQYLYL